MVFHFVFGAIIFVPKLKIALIVSLLFRPSLEDVVAAEEAVEGMVVRLPE